jgi:hypothetical protein
VEKGRQRILDLIVKDKITDAQADAKLDELKAEEAQVNGELEKLAASLAAAPDMEKVKQTALQVVEVCGDIFLEDEAGNRYAGGNDVQSYLMMSGEDKKRLVDLALSGRLPDRKPAGVYVTPAGGEKYGPKRFSYVIRGMLNGTPLTAIKGVTPRASYCRCTPRQIAIADRRSRRRRRPCTG